MTPILYDKTCTDKIAFLSDCVSCTVTEERNGSYLLELEYPVSGKYFSELAETLCIKAKPNNTDNNQYFQIYEITKPMNGYVTVYAHHVSYQLSGYPIKTYKQTAIAPNAVISSLLGIANGFRSGETSFTLGTCDISTLSSVDFKALSVRAALGGTDGSVLDDYGGEFKFDNFSVSLLRNRGADNGVRISYGKNLTDLKLTINTESSYTGIFPYVWDDENYITLSANSGVIDVTNLSGIERKILLLDCSSLFEDNTPKTEANLRICAETYLETHDINAVEGSLTVEFVDLSKAKAFDLIASLEAVNLCDTVKVIHPVLGISVQMKVIKTVYDVPAEKYKKLELGSPRSSFADTISQTTKTANDALKKATEGQSALAAEFNQAIDSATNAITGATGGHVILNPSRNPQELLLLVDSDDIETATKLYRFNSAGLAYSSHGYDGPYETALLGNDGKLVINDVTARLISANLIRAGSIVSVSGDMVLNLDGSTLTSGAASSTKTIFEAGHIDFFYNNNFSGRLGQSGSNELTIENESHIAKILFASATGNITTYGQVIASGNITTSGRFIASGNIDLIESGRYLRSFEGEQPIRLIGIDSGAAANLYVGENDSSIPGYNSIVYSSHSRHIFKINGTTVGYIDANGFHNGAP